MFFQNNSIFKLLVWLITAKLIKYWTNKFKKHDLNYNNKIIPCGALTPNGQTSSKY